MNIVEKAAKSSKTFTILIEFSFALIETVHYWEAVSFVIKLEWLML